MHSLVFFQAGLIVKIYTDRKSEQKRWGHNGLPPVCCVQTYEGDMIQLISGQHMVQVNSKFLDFFQEHAYSHDFVNTITKMLGTLPVHFVFLYDSNIFA